MLTKTNGIRILVFIMAFYGCTKKEVLEFSLKSDVKGKINTVSEFGENQKNYQGITINVDGGEAPIALSTDTSGSYVIPALPIGTYCIRYSKEGYGEKIVSNIKVVGSDKPITLNLYLAEKSKTVVTDYTVGYNNGSITLKGSLKHDFPSTKYYPYLWPRIEAFIGTSSDVSNKKFNLNFVLNANETNDTEFSYTSTISSKLFPSGSTVYVALYGFPGYSYYYDDLETGVFYNSCLGVVSEVKSIKIP